MTEREFLKRLRQTPRDWRVTYWGHIRRYADANSPRCPISSLVASPCSQYKECAGWMRIPPKLRDRIFAASDDYGERGLRQKLLRACGIAKK